MEQTQTQEQTTPKEVIEVDYSDSGAKTLDGFSTFFFIVAGIAFSVAFISLIWLLVELGAYNSSVAAPFALMMTCIYIALAGLLAGAICKGLSSIVQVVVYQRTLLERDYDFKELKKVSGKNYTYKQPIS